MGFQEHEVLPPDYMYAGHKERKPKSEYSLDKFQHDPKLEWADGFTEEELAYLNDLDRIWDAGRTSYRLIVGR